MKTILRYSPLPIEAYSPVHEGVLCGPASSPFLQDVRAWNLAYLSHPFEDMRDPENPSFNVHVRRTLQYVLETGVIDIAGLVPASQRVMSWMQCPAPRVVLLIKEMPDYKQLPLFKEYGQVWVDTIEQRSWLCEPMEPDDGIVNMHESDSFLEKFRK